MRISTTVAVSVVYPGVTGGAIFSGRDAGGAFLRFVAHRDRIFRPPVVGEVWSLEGECERHPMYGEQVRVQRASLVQPSGKLIGTRP